MDKDRVYLDYEQEYYEERKARYAAQSELIASQARLSEAVKVLERLAEGEMSDAGHTALREAAKAFLATLGEENG